MARGFAVLLAVVIVVGLAMGAGLGAWQAPGKSAVPVIAEGQDNQRAPGQPAASALGQVADASGRTMVFGTVQTVSDKSIVLAAQSGSSAVSLTSNTKIFKEDSASADQIEAGDGILATGQKTQDGSLTADSVDVGPTEAMIGFSSVRMGQRASGDVAATPSAATWPQGRQRVTGSVETIGGKEITVKTDDGSVKVTLGDSTAIRSVTPGNLTDLTTGVAVVVVGERDSDGTIAASIIRVTNNRGSSAGPS